MRPGADVVCWRAAQRKIEHDQLQLARAGFSNADVFGLKIAVCNTTVFKVIHDLYQFFTKALQQIERQAAVFLEFFRKGVRTGTAHQQGGASGHGEGATVFHNVLVTQAREHFALGNQAVIVRQITGNLDD